MIRGMTVEELHAVDASRIAFAVGGLAPESKHAAVLCADAVGELREKLRH
jgi:hypothetical protein